MSISLVETTISYLHEDS